MRRAIKVKILKETPNKVTILLRSANRKMHVKRDDFEKRVKEGMYEIVGKKKKKEEVTDEEDE